MTVLRDILGSVREVLRSYRGALFVQLMSKALWDGRAFRQYFPFTVNVQFRFVAARPFILSDQVLYVGEGRARVTVYTGSTPSGVWAPTLTQTGKNRYTAEALAYTQQNIVEAGGTFVGGTEREQIRANAGVGQGNASRTVDSNVRVLPPGTYYFDITVTGTTSGIYAFEWEEL